MRCLGLDLGTKTLGIAISDKTNVVASFYKVLRYDDVLELINELRDIIETNNITDIALGLPKNMNNSLGPASERSLAFKELLEKEIPNIKVSLIDERLSTVEATNYLLQADMSRKKRKKVVDGVAASIILDTYLKMKGE
ncbi:MAG: Holliday junction resolvase RuvX [Bacilli bacterium]